MKKNKKETTNYPGAKSGSGIYQRIINLMPPHRVYIEAFAGGGSIYRHKKKAAVDILIDKDITVIEKFRGNDASGPITVCGDSVPFLKAYNWKGDELIYCDPPYILSTRHNKKIYKFEMTDKQHKDLTATLLQVPAAVMVSGYRNAIYDAAFRKWLRIDYKATTRGGLKTESLWINFKPPAVPADLTYLGKNYRERERIKRKKLRWKNKLKKLPIAEQLSIMEVLLELTTSETTSGAGLNRHKRRGGPDPTAACGGTSAIGPAPPTTMIRSTDHKTTPTRLKHNPD